MGFPSDGFGTAQGEFGTPGFFLFGTPTGVLELPGLVLELLGLILEVPGLVLAVPGLVLELRKMGLELRAILEQAHVAHLYDLTRRHPIGQIHVGFGRIV